MSVRLLCTRTSRPVSLGHLRLATVALTGRRPQVLSSALSLQTGMVLVEVEAVGAGAFYDVPASGFVWRSHDGTVSAFNEIAFSGGGLVDNGTGPGTLIKQARRLDPLLGTAYLQSV